MDYIFDGSYAGYLTGFFECFERREWFARPVSDTGTANASLFNGHRHIITDTEKARRVAAGLSKKTGERAKEFLHVFLSEDPKAWQNGYRMMRMVFERDASVLLNFGDPDVLCFSQTLKKVHRERHRMKAFVRFGKSADGLFLAKIEPDFNVLPLIVSFFKNRYADQRWLIYDLKRDYGILYDLATLQEVRLTRPDDRTEKTAATSELSLAWDERDELFKRLWKQYFKSTNIPARRNLKLHVQHVPKRYWKHLVEIVADDAAT